MRRGKVDVVTVSIMKDRMVTTSHGVPVMADKLFEECDFSDGDALFLPGGLPGTDNLEAHEGLSRLIDRYYEEGKYLTAICAAPRILGHHNILQGKKATCFPEYIEDLYGATVTGNGVEKDGKIITGRGMGTAIPFALKLAEVLMGAEKAEQVRESILF